MYNKVYITTRMYELPVRTEYRWYSYQYKLQLQH